jgi:hypothetical protein
MQLLTQRLDLQRAWSKTPKGLRLEIPPFKRECWRLPSAMV